MQRWTKKNNSNSKKNYERFLFEFHFYSLILLSN